MSELVSIVTSLYNYRRYIEDLIASVLGQSYDNWEHIIVDDGSTDKPFEVIDPFLKDKRFRYSFMSNRGYSTAKNQGIMRSRGKYIVMIDADDMLTPRSLELRKKALDENPDKLWCHGEVLVTDDHGRSTSERSRNWKRNFRKKLTDDGLDLTKTYHHRLVHAQSVMVRPELHRKYGLYDESLRFSSDNEMWRRVIRFGEVPVHIEDFVAIYRVHGARMSRSQYKKERGRQVKRRIIEDVERRFREGINETNTKLWASG
jgi:glycosyltransferase involved in cell wall biosynthesis